MNTANLQLEGLCVALSSILGALREKGLLSQKEIDASLAAAEDAVRNDAGRPETLSAANVEAICFPIRFLRTANRNPEAAPPRAFSQTATDVGHDHRRG